MPRKPIITAAIAASLATSANATSRTAQDTQQDGDIIAYETVADDILIHESTDTDLGDLIDPWNPPDLENADPETQIYLAQTIYAGGGDDNIAAPNRSGKGLKIQKPGQGITLDNGIKKPGKLRTQDQAGQALRKGKKRKKLK